MGAAIRLGVRIALTLIAAVLTLALAAVVLVALWIGMGVVSSFEPATWHAIGQGVFGLTVLTLVVIRFVRWFGPYWERTSGK